MGKDAEDDSASKSVMEKPPCTPDMSACETKDMVNAMLWDSPLRDAERSDEKLPEDDGSGKLPEEEDDGEKLPEGGNDKLPKETPAGKLVRSCIRKLSFSLLLI